MAIVSAAPALKPSRMVSLMKLTSELNRSSQASRHMQAMRNAVSAAMSALTAFLMACMCLLAWLLRLSSLVNFISETILLGFKAGAALTIAMTQLPKLFGDKGGGHNFFEGAYSLATQLP